VRCHCHTGPTITSDATVMTGGAALAGTYAGTLPGAGPVGDTFWQAVVIRANAQLSSAVRFMIHFSIAGDV